MRFRASGPQPTGDYRAEGKNPAPDALVGNHDAALGQEFLDVSEAEFEAKLHPYSALDDVRRETVARIEQWGHAAQLRARVAKARSPNVTSPLTEGWLERPVQEDGGAFVRRPIAIIGIPRCRRPLPRRKHVEPGSSFNIA
jgi:hypothetical protein